MKILLINTKAFFDMLKKASSAIMESGKTKIDTFIGACIGTHETAKWKPQWAIYKYHGDCACPENLYAVEEIKGNKLLNEGVTELLKLLIGNTATAFNSSNAFIGVGDSAVAEDAAQTGLQASTNKQYKSMDSGYPQVSGQTALFRATFGAAEANFTWNEFTVANGTSDSAVNLNRKVENHGTKNGDTWVLQMSATLS